MEWITDWAGLWGGLGWPLLRLLFFIALGLFIANLIEALNWTRAMAKLAAPLVRAGRLQDVAGASFSMAFFSGVAANSMLSEAHAKGEMSNRELILSNMFNSLPTYFTHLPTMFFITLPFIGWAAFLYVGLTFISAVMRTACIVALGHYLLPPLPEGCIVCRLDEHRSPGFKDAVRKSWLRLKKRMRRVAFFTVPIYIALYALREAGLFIWLEKFMAEHVSVLSFLPPQAISIVIFHVAAEFTAGLAAAGALLQDGGLGANQVVMALLVGNILSTPMRTFRHQFPYYAGIFKPRMALKLILYNQVLRNASLVVVAVLFYFLAEPIATFFS